jgi:uncharacterized protein
MNDQESEIANNAPCVGHETAAAETSLNTPATVECWRCGKQVESTLPRCRFCAAALSATELTTTPITASAEDDARKLFRILAIYGCMLATSIVYGLLHLNSGFVSTNHIAPSQGEVLSKLLIFEGLDTILILSAWAWIRISVRKPHKSLARYAIICSFFIPVLALGLLVNMAYHWLLRQWLNITPVEEVFAHNSQYLWWWLTAICFQPALIEELFFRGLAFGALCPVTGLHTVVWITSLMFAMAHIGVPLSMPVLFVLGLGLGYARMLSGGLILPITLHFFHNLVIMYLNGFF